MHLASYTCSISISLSRVRAFLNNQIRLNLQLTFPNKYIISIICKIVVKSSQQNGP